VITSKLFGRFTIEEKSAENWGGFFELSFGTFEVHLWWKLWKCEFNNQDTGGESISSPKEIEIN